MLQLHGVSWVDSYPIGVIETVAFFDCGPRKRAQGARNVRSLKNGEKPMRKWMRLAEASLAIAATRYCQNVP